MTLIRRALFVLPLALLIAGPAEASKRHGHGGGSWDGRWAGAWGGSDPCAVIVKGGKVVAYEYAGATNPVHWSKVSPKHITYGENDVVVNLTRTGANTAHATIKTPQGSGAAEMTRK